MPRRRRRRLRLDAVGAAGRRAPAASALSLRALGAIAAALALSLAGCDPDEAAPDAGLPDASPDAFLDAAALDAAAPLDLALPDPVDGPADVEAPDDARPADAALDAELDADPDASPDAALDAEVDAAPDAEFDPNRENRCEDGLDDDGDGAVDCEDGDCLAAAPCRGVPVTVVERVQVLFLERCGCHTGDVDLGGLVLNRPFTDTTVGVPAILAPDLLLVEPGDHPRSFLYRKIAGTHGPGEGELMPPEPPPLRDFELALVAEWIDGLAVAP